jgi:hypothetical protein
VSKINLKNEKNQYYNPIKGMNEPFAVVQAENEFELCDNNLVPVHLEYEKRNNLGEEKAFRMLPRRFATNLLKIEGNSMFSEEKFNEIEKKVLDDFVEKKYIQSTKIAGKDFYFNLSSKIKKYLIGILQIQK